ncbi:MAG: NAD(P)/FAD-dependent oxidoreductase [Burkholderiaceae bacterium]
MSIDSTQQNSTQQAAAQETRVDAIIVGAGFAGMLMIYRLRELGFSVCCVEMGDGVGGTWYWNRYPGARVDIESMEYSYQFSHELQQEWSWSERFAPQPELLRYANHVADRFNLREHIRFNTRVVGADFNDNDESWTVTTNSGNKIRGQFLICATGCLSSTNQPQIEGLDTFRGPVHHTGQWPHEPVSFDGLRVGVIGTGSSAVQAIPVIAESAGHLTVFQRTANYSVPARNRPMDPAYESQVKSDYLAFRERNNRMPNGFGSNNPRGDQSALEVSETERLVAYEDRWQRGGLFFMGAFTDLIFDQQANDTAAEFVRQKIAATVDDPVTAALLQPKQTIGCKRICIDTNYFETYNRPNVSLVDISENGIERITPDGLITAGSEHPLDMLVLATGFDAMTGTLLRMNIRGRGGQTLVDKWAAGPRNYLGLTTHGFPNMFMVSGPGSPSVLTNMLVSIEQHARWIAGCLAHMRSQHKRVIEADPAAEDDWVGHVNSVADSTLYPTCNSWYLGANVPGKPRVFMPLLGFPAYADRCDQVVAEGYSGFVLSE